MTAARSRITIVALAFAAVLANAACGGGDDVRAAARLTGGDSDRGRHAIRRYGCDACHTIPGVATAHGLVGPPLTAIGVRGYLGGELTNTPFLARLAHRGRPMLVSTGMADMVEVATAVDTIRANGDVPLALFHCVSSYPAAPTKAALKR